MKLTKVDQILAGHETRPPNIHVYTRPMTPIHIQVLEAACRIADERWTFRISHLVRVVPHLNVGTVRTHVASRCTVNAPAHHQSRYGYFCALGRGVYRVEPRFRRRAFSSSRGAASQDLILASMDSGVDPTLIAESLAITPTDRLEAMRRAARSFDAMKVT